MKAVVVYESHWGNTAEIARAIAEGIGPEAQVLTTEEASREAVANVDLMVVGAPVIAFGLPSPRAEDVVAATAGEAPTPPAMIHPSMFWWLADLPQGSGEAAAFETHIRWAPGGATGPSSVAWSTRATRSRPTRASSWSRAGMVHSATESSTGPAPGAAACGPGSASAS